MLLSLVMFGIWKPPPEHHGQWDDDIDDQEMGNFIHVKKDVWSVFVRSLMVNDQPEATVIFDKTSNTVKDNQIYCYVFTTIYPYSKTAKIAELRGWFWRYKPNSMGLRIR